MNYKQKDLPPEGINKPEEKVLIVLLKALGVISLIAIVFYSLSFFVSPVLARLTPRSLELKIGEFFYNKKPLTDSDLEKNLAGVWLKVKEAVPEDLKESKIYVMDSKIENALAFPGGNIALTSGFLNSAESLNEKIFVLGHELGHQNYRHPLKAFYSQLVSSAMMSLLSGSESVSDFIWKASNSLFSREQETEADFFALNLVQKVSGTAKGAFGFFKRRQKKQKGRGRFGEDLFSSHPELQKRIDYLKVECLKTMGEEDCS